MISEYLKKIKNNFIFIFRYKTIFRRKTCKLNKLSNNMSPNNTIIEDNISSNVNVNCDTHMDNSMLITILKQFNFSTK